MGEPTVSVIMPTYNRGHHLSRSVGSVLGQTFGDFELLIVDDGSTDNTAEVVAGFNDPRVRYIRREMNGGVAAARNTGVRAARGRFLAFQDSDDEWLLGKLEKQINDLASGDDSCMSVCGLIRTGLRADHGRWILNYPRLPAEWARGLTHREVLRSSVAYTQTWLVPRQAVLACGGFDETLQIWDDWDLLIRLSMSLRIRTCTTPLVLSERVTDSLSADKSRFAHDFAVILNKYRDHLQAYRLEHAHLQSLFGEWLMRTGHVTRARMAILRSLWLDPLRGSVWTQLRLSARADSLVRDILVPLLKPIDRILQLVLPVADNRVMYFSRPDYGDNAYYVYKHLIQTRNSIEHIWMLMDLANAEKVRREFDGLVHRAGTRGHTLRIVKTRTFRGYFLSITSRNVFHTHGVAAISNWAFRRNVVCLWHGMPIKCIGRLNHIFPKRYPTYGTIHVATSHFFKYIIASAFGAKPGAVKVVGLPRCDALTHESARETDAQEIRERLGIPSGRKFLLWMPTYRTEPIRVEKNKEVHSFLNDLPGWMLPALIRQCEENGFTIVIKLHWLDPLNQVELAPLHDSIKIMKSHEWLSQGIQLYDLIAASDALISDVSSILIDYLITGRPIAIAGFNRNTYTRDLVFPIDIILNSQRYHYLVNEESMGAFAGAIRGGADATDDNHDVADMLYEEQPVMSSEAIVAEVGL